MKESFGGEGGWSPPREVGKQLRATVNAKARKRAVRMTFLRLAEIGDL
jgi:hypothetical protein